MKEILRKNKSKNNKRQLQSKDLQIISNFFSLFSDDTEISESKDMVMYCRATGKPIYEIIEGRQDRYISSHGQCIECHEYKSIEELKTSDGMSPAKWPVRYVGYTCKDCFDNL